MHKTEAHSGGHCGDLGGSVSIKSNEMGENQGRMPQSGRTMQSGCLALLGFQHLT